MMGSRWWFMLAAAATALSPALAGAQTQGPGSSAQVPTIQVTSKLVFLDVTVLDKKGKPVVNGLTKDDFTITEGKTPERIFSFEAPDVHTLNTGASADNPDGKAPRTIIVLDQLNSSFQDFAYIRFEVRRFLAFQPKELRSPTELMIAGNNSLELLQNYTRDRDEILHALEHIPPAIPYKMNASFWAERLAQSFDALNQIALENGGYPGRKNIIWVGHGGPGVNTVLLDSDTGQKVQQYAHMITNLLVDARVSLFVLYPGLQLSARIPRMGSVLDAGIDIGDDGPFATTGDVNFGVFVDETGGKLFYNRNDVDEEMRESERMGSEYYTLTYQPHGGDDNGRFRRIRVTLRDPNLRAVTKAGYYAPDRKAPIDPRMQLMQTVVEAARSTIPFDALHVNLIPVARHPDMQTAQLTAWLQPKGVTWLADADGRLSADVVIATASLSQYRDVLTSKVQELRVMANTQDIARLEAAKPIPVSLTLRIPQKARSVRLVIETETGGRIGTAELRRKDIDAAPAEPTPQPQLSPRSNAGQRPVPQ